MYFRLCISSEIPFAVLVTGKLNSCAESILQMNTEQDGANDESNVEFIEKLHRNILALIELAYEPDKFDGMRRDKSNLDLFRTFVNFYLAHCCNIHMALQSIQRRNI